MLSAKIEQEKALIEQERSQQPPTEQQALIEAR
jgi:hypothetical protein